MSHTPILDLLTDKAGDSQITRISKYAYYREKVREILDSKNILKAINLLEIAYRNQVVSILLPQPMEEIEQAPMDYLDWSLKDEGNNNVGCLVGSCHWYPGVAESKSENNIIELELDRDHNSANIIVNGNFWPVKSVKVNEQDTFEYFAVSWPRHMKIEALVKLSKDVSYCYLELPRCSYDVDAIADNLTESDEVLDFLVDVDLLESFHLADNNLEKIAIVILAMYNSLTR